MSDTKKAVAAVDIGTNSVKITVASKTDTGRLEILADRTIITRLGKNVDAEGRLQQSAVDKTLHALEQFAQEARSLGASQIAAVGTSALRDASNGSEVVSRMAEILGGKVEIISGDREAELIYTAARRDPDLPRPNDAQTLLATIDIGGGSTEIVLGRGEAVAYRESLQLGAVRVTERTLPSDPPSTKELERATQMADELLARVPDGEKPIVIGSGGTAANLAMMELSANEPSPSLEKAHGMRITLAQIEARISDLASKPLEERRKTPGLEPDRADVIVAGAIVQARALHRFGADELIVSLRGLRYGLLYEMLG